jgi:hypothetical protein
MKGWKTFTFWFIIMCWALYPAVFPEKTVQQKYMPDPPKGEFVLGWDYKTKTWKTQTKELNEWKQKKDQPAKRVIKDTVKPGVKVYLNRDSFTRDQINDIMDYIERLIQNQTIEIDEYDIEDLIDYMGD